MDTLLNLTNANELYEDVVNDGNLRLVHETEHQDITYDTFISTRCNSTADTICYLISDDKHWSTVKTPTSEVYRISFRYECHDIEEDDPIHSMIVHNECVYQSYCDMYSLRKTYIPNLHDLLIDPRRNWFQLTGDTFDEHPKLLLVVQYSQPQTFNLLGVETKYKQLHSL